jgi:hypothetical protein
VRPPLARSLAMTTLLLLSVVRRAERARSAGWIAKEKISRAESGLDRWAGKRCCATRHGPVAGVDATVFEGVRFASRTVKTTSILQPLYEETLPMTAKNEFEKDPKVSTTPEDKAALSPDTKRELTDEEIASVAGGGVASSTHGTATNTIPVGKTPGKLA